MPDTALRGWRGAAAFALSLALVFAIALLRRWSITDALDLSAMRWVGIWRTDATSIVTSAMLVATAVGDTLGRIVLVIVLAAWLAYQSRWRDAGWLVAVVIGGTLLNLILKQMFAAPRPDLLPHLDVVNSYSFPSGHATGNMIFFGAAMMLIRTRTAWAIGALMILWIGASRIWLGVHWPTDVLAGWIEGIGWLCLCSHWLPAHTRGVSRT